MELRQLAYFVTVAHEESFTRAAERLHVAQPGVSQQIRRLEEEFGARLFDRSGRGPWLTTAGKALLPHARTRWQPLTQDEPRSPLSTASSPGSCNLDPSPVSPESTSPACSRRSTPHTPTWRSP